MIGNVDIAAREIRLNGGGDIVVAMSDLGGDKVVGVFLGVGPGQAL